MGTVGVGASVGHGQDARTGVLQGEVLGLELVAIDGLSSSSIAGSEVSPLAHEVGDHSVEGGALVAESLLSSAQSTEVLSSLVDNIIPQLHDDFANWGAICGHIKENSCGCHYFRFSLSKFCSLHDSD